MTVQIVAQADIDRLLEKQWRARIALRRNPYAYALNVRWRKEFADRLKKKQFTDVTSTIAFTP